MESARPSKPKLLIGFIESTDWRLNVGDQIQPCPSPTVKLRRKQAALRYKIIARRWAWINEIHWKTARWLCSQHSAVLLGKLNVKALSSKTGGLGAIAPNFVACGHKSLRPKNRGRKFVISVHTFSLEKECGRRPHSFSLAPDPPTMGRSNVRKLYAWSHYKFQQRLLCKAEELCCDAYVVNEAWTSKTCTACGHIHHKLGASKTFECPSCGVVLDRDGFFRRKNTVLAPPIFVFLFPLFCFYLSFTNGRQPQRK